jgi:23S rRNA (pseudouridine1915-N3)-methyltransferase
MRLTIAAVGRLKSGPERELFDRYCERVDALARTTALGPTRLAEIAESRAGSVAARKSEEAERLIDKVTGAAHLIALDARGKTMTSEAFAALLGQRRDSGTTDMAFLIGGADGHGEAVLARADLRLSLGAMTLPHGLARVILVEQLYRASTILAGHPYHRA